MEPSLEKNVHQENDLGMLFIKELGLFLKIHQDSKGKFVNVPKHGKCYLSQEIEEKP